MLQWFRAILRRSTTFGFDAAWIVSTNMVTPAIYTSRMPDDVPDEVAGPIMCSAATMHRPLKASGLQPGEWVVFSGGGGGVGIQGVKLAKIMGIRPIIVDSGKQKRALALKLGAEHVHWFGSELSERFHGRRTATSSFEENLYCRHARRKHAGHGSSAGIRSSRFVTSYVRSTRTWSMARKCSAAVTWRDSPKNSDRYQ